MSERYVLMQAEVEKGKTVNVGELKKFIANEIVDAEVVKVIKSSDEVKIIIRQKFNHKELKDELTYYQSEGQDLDDSMDLVAEEIWGMSGEGIVNDALMDSSSDPLFIVMGVWYENMCYTLEEALVYWEEDEDD